MTVEQTRSRSGWSAKRTLAALGISRGSYYRWLQEEAWAREKKEELRPVQAFEALPEERAAVIAIWNATMDETAVATPL